MKKRVAQSGLRRHRPKKRFRFEYTGVRYSQFPKAERPFWRAFDEMEKEQDGYLDLVERFEMYKRGAGRACDDVQQQNFPDGVLK